MMVIVFYVMNYVIKVEDLVWKWVVVVMELFFVIKELMIESWVEGVG